MSHAASTSEYFNLRRESPLPEGTCIYIQSGDPSDVDGYLIAIAGAELESETKDFRFAIVVPERRACPDRAEPDVNKHVQEFSKEVMNVSHKILNLLCPKSFKVRGLLNTRNVIPLKFIFSEPERYGGVLGNRHAGEVNWKTIKQLAEVINQPQTTSVVLDMNGAMGYLEPLADLVPQLGSKIKASGFPVTIMAGILAEAVSGTLRVPGRDPRSTMNAIYHAGSVHLLLTIAQESKIPLLFVTNNVCNQILKFENGHEVVENFAMEGLLKDLSLEWYGDHLKGKCVPFDWVSFVAMLLIKRWPYLMKVEKRELWVGKGDASVLVLKSLKEPKVPQTDVEKSNLENTLLWGKVDSVVDIDKALMLELGRYICQRHVV